MWEIRAYIYAEKSCLQTSCCIFYFDITECLEFQEREATLQRELERKLYQQNNLKICWLLWQWSLMFSFENINPTPMEEKIYVNGSVQSVASYIQLRSSSRCIQIAKML